MRYFVTTETHDNGIDGTCDYLHGRRLSTGRSRLTVVPNGGVPIEAPPIGPGEAGGSVFREELWQDRIGVIESQYPDALCLSNSCTYFDGGIIYQENPDGRFGIGVGPGSISRVGVAARAGAQLTGQMHHGISRTIHKALEQHPNLRGVYQARDPRFVTQARDALSHRGYQQWHRNLDAEVAGWVRGNPNATPAQFESYLRGVYQRPDVLARFPNGL